MGTEEFLRHVTERLHAHEEVLLQGLSADNAKKVLSPGTIIRARSGDKILRAGDAESDMYLVLAGAVEVRAGGAGSPPRVLETLGRGQIFGEMSFLTRRRCTADVVAISDVELLALKREFLERLMASAPWIASRMLLNLSVYMCERLHTTTLSLVAVERDGADVAAAVT